MDFCWWKWKENYVNIRISSFFYFLVDDAIENQLKIIKYKKHTIHKHQNIQF